jgi:hypothetical protein
LLHAEKTGQLNLPNTNFDVGDESYPGKYRLNDDAHAELLHQLAGNKFNGVTPQLRAELLSFYSHPDAPYSTKKNPRAWAQVELEIERLKEVTAASSQAVSAGTPDR